MMTNLNQILVIFVCNCCLYLEIYHLECTLLSGVKLNTMISNLFNSWLLHYLFIYVILVASFAVLLSLINL